MRSSWRAWSDTSFYHASRCRTSVCYRIVFMGGAAGVFGNAMGGRRGAIIAGLLLGFIFQMIVAIAYPILGLDGYGIQGLWFASTDAIIVIVIIRLIGALFGIAL